MSQAEDIRRVAIEHHDLVADRFDSECAALDSSRFRVAFVCGRQRSTALLTNCSTSRPQTPPCSTWIAGLAITSSESFATA